MKVLIIGGVAGGASCAARLRRIDEFAEIIMFEKGEYISFANCGLPYYIGDVITRKENLTLNTPESFKARFNIDVRNNSEVLSVDVNNKTIKVKDTINNKTYDESYDKLVIAPGAKPIVPKLKGIEKGVVFTLRNIPDTYKIKNYVETNKPKTVTVIGGGFIGIEMAENLKKLGLSVNIVEAASHVIAALDNDMAYDVQNYIRQNGINIYLDSTATEILEDGIIINGNKKIESDFIIMSVGVRPETEFLKDSGIELGTRGQILVDEYLQTNVENIYALGDAIFVKSYVSDNIVHIPLASPANKQGRIVANNLCGKDEVYNGTLGTAIVKIFDMTVALTGENENSLTNSNTEYLKVMTNSFSNATYYPGAKAMFIKLLFNQKGKILGSQIVGYKGVDKRIDVIATAIKGDMTVYDLYELELAYAPPFSSAKDPVNIAGYVASNVLEKRTRPIYIDELESIDNKIIIDVRTENEFESGNIEDSINIPLDEIRNHLNSIPKDKKIIISCQIGLRGYIAEQILRQHGFDVYNLVGGFRHYKQFIENKKYKLIFNLKQS